MILKSRKNKESLSRACRIPEASPRSPTLLMMVKQDSIVTLGAVVLAIMLIFTPYFVGLYAINLAPPTGMREIMGVDTYVSSEDSVDHSNETLVSISNVATGDNASIEIAIFGFEYLPGGSIFEVYLNFYCNNVKSGGTINLHTVNPDNPLAFFDSYFTNLTYEDMPVYNSTPFIEHDIQTNGSYSIKIPFDEYRGWNFLSGFLGIAVTAEPGVQLTWDSFESPMESQKPRLVTYETVGIAIRNPWLYYMNPILLAAPITAIFILVILYQRIKKSS